MSGSRGILIVVLIAVVGLAIAPLATAGFADPFDGPTNAFDSEIDDETGDRPASAAGHATQADTESAENGDSPGTNVSTFMQSSAAETETAVDIGIFNASYENADDQARKSIVTQRAGTLEDRVAELEAERERLESNEDEMNPVAYDARMTRLAVQISALEKSVSTVEQHATDIDADVPALEELHSSATSLRTPDVTEAADGLIGIDFSDPVPESVQDQVNESTADIGDIDPESVTNGSTVLSAAENETSLADSAVNTAAVADGSINATDIPGEPVNATDATDVVGSSLNATDGSIPVTNRSDDAEVLEGSINGTEVVDYPVDESADGTDDGHERIDTGGDGAENGTTEVNKDVNESDSGSDESESDASWLDELE
ncbi:hypothetical protein [Halostagnicola sp. A56]|uniref:hypothetical protein n=1 Tax=Halostagnicola sp. A56 TaxID=1495067 RepID=UPI0004A13768|nr:hypothetical protein [Halostagnicola sp. A56]